MGQNPQRTQVNIQVEPETKEKWKEAAEGPEYGSVSALVRRAVAREIAPERSHTDATTDARAGAENRSGDLSESIGDVHSDVREILTHIGSIEEDLQPVLTALEKSENQDMTELMNQVFSSLPRSKAGSPELQEESGDPAIIADELGVPEREVRTAIDQLREDMPGVIAYSESLEEYFIRED